MSSLPYRGGEAASLPLRPCPLYQNHALIQNLTPVLPELNLADSDLTGGESYNEDRSALPPENQVVESHANIGFQKHGPGVIGGLGWGEEVLSIPSPGEQGRDLVSRTRSPGYSPARKRLKLDVSGLSPVSKQKRICEHRMTKLRHVSTTCREDLTELYFLTSGSNVIDLPMFRKKPTPAFVAFLKTHQAPQRIISEVQTAVIGNALKPLEVRRHTYSPRVTLLSPVKVGQSQEMYSGRLFNSVSRPCSAIPPPTGPSYTLDQIHEKIKQEGWVLRRVTELTRDGLWPAKRLPKVVEQPRPVAAWDLVLEEMKWMAADFQQERIWKQSAARVQSAAVKEHVADIQALKVLEQEELHNSIVQRRIAHSLAEQVKVFWNHVSSLYEYEKVKRKTLFNTSLIYLQLGHVTGAQQSLHLSTPNSARKRRIQEISSSEYISPVTSDHFEGNGVQTDDESTIAEQEAYELLHCISDNELFELERDAETELTELLRENYPGSLTEYLYGGSDEYLNIYDSEDVDSDLENSESHTNYSLQYLVDFKERSGKSNGDLNTKDLIEISETAENQLPKSVINLNGVTTNPKLFKGRLRDYQLVGLDWLQNLYSRRLPAILADENGLGRRILTSAFISYLVYEMRSPLPNLILSPASRLHRWKRILSNFCPGLRVSIYTGSLVDKEEFLENPSHIVLVSYRVFFSDRVWFFRRKWGVTVLAEVQNVVAAGSPDNILCLCELHSQQRLLIMSGPHKENPIDLWNVLYLLFPGLYETHTESLVEGTTEYIETVAKLQKILASFTLARSRVKYPSIEKQLSFANEVLLYVNLSSKQRKLYDDYLAKSHTQDLLRTGDLSAVCSVIQALRTICNQPSSKSGQPYTCLVKSSSGIPPLPTWCRLNPRPARPVQRLVSSCPLDSVSLENMNLVFLKQELTTTVLTSARLRSIKASRELIQELSAGTTAVSSYPKHFSPRVPIRKMSFSLEGITRTVHGWNIPGGWVEGMGLVRAASGQVFKVCCNSLDKVKTAEVTPAASTSTGDLLLPDSLNSIAEVNHWRCSGFPLYGQDLIRSLEVTNSVRPTRSRFGGQGYINCLTAPVLISRQEPDDWRYTTTRLEPLLLVGTGQVEEVQGVLSRLNRFDQDPRSSSPKLQVLDRLLEERYRSREQVLILINDKNLVPTLQQYCFIKSFRYLVVNGDMNYAEKMSIVERFSQEPRLFILILAGVHSFAGLQLPQVGTVVEYDWSPSNTDQRILGYTPITIFRLLCRGTVEESMNRRNLLRRVLSDLESGLNQSTLKKQTLEDLFNPPLDSGFVWNEKKKKDKLKDEMDEKTAVSQVCSLLGITGSYQPECLLDLAEFDTMGMEDSPGTLTKEDTNLMAWIENISSIQRYGMKQLNECPEIKTSADWKIVADPSNKEQLCLNLETEVARRAQKRRRTEETLEYVTFPSHLNSREWRDEEGELTLWKPPTYFEELEDTSTSLLYRKKQMMEEELPAVYIKKEKKRDTPIFNQSISSPVAGMPLSPADKPKIKKEESIATAPKSIFDRPKPFKTIARPKPSGVAINPTSFVTAQSTASTPLAIQGLKTVVREGDSGPDWLIQEDWALHQAVLTLQEMPLSLSANSPAHISNWDMVADIVNAVSKCFRSPRQCRNRYETTVLPREEGKIMYNDITPSKKPKKK